MSAPARGNGEDGNGKEAAGAGSDFLLSEDEDDDDDGDLHPFLATYKEWLAHQAREAGGSAEGQRLGGRPVDPQNTVSDEEFVLAVWFGEHSDAELMETFGLTSVDVVYRHKRRLGLTHLRTGGSRPDLPTLAELQHIWELQPRTTPLDLALELRVGLRTLQRHFAAVGFSPRVAPDDGPVIEALRELAKRGWCSDLGATFARACLQRQYGIYATAHQIRRCLRACDPDGVRRRAKEAQRTRFVYNVPGPRSLYHIDAHEKLAKIWGIWIHICVDGYSRYVVYLKPSTDKYAETVRQIFLDGMNAPHPGNPQQTMWPSRIRADKGSENQGWAQEQILRMGENRGSVIFGRSVQNCRAEYLWVRVRRHVTDYFRSVFFDMQKQGHLDVNSPTDLHCLQAVFMPQVEAACEDFREMWNHHRIRGRRTEAGHGGGIPSELFLDPVLSETVLNDDAAYAADPDSYGVDEPIRADDDEHGLGDDHVTFDSKHVIDPLAAHPHLQAVRRLYFEHEPLAHETDGLADYIRYRYVCLELLSAAIDYASTDGQVDWAAYAGRPSVHAPVNAADLRKTLACLAVHLEGEDAGGAGGEAPEADPE